MVVTSDDVDEVVEGDAAVALVSLLEGCLQLAVLSLGEDAPLLVEQLFEVEPRFPVLLGLEHVRESYIFNSN